MFWRQLLKDPVYVITYSHQSPGVTQALQTKIRVSDDPLIFLLDTSGIMMPNIRNIETGMKLATCGIHPRLLKTNLKILIVKLKLFVVNLKVTS